MVQCSFRKISILHSCRDFGPLRAPYRRTPTRLHDTLCCQVYGVYLRILRLLRRKRALSQGRFSRVSFGDLVDRDNMDNSIYSCSILKLGSAFSMQVWVIPFHRLLSSKSDASQILRPIRVTPRVPRGGIGALFPHWGNWTKMLHRRNPRRDYSCRWVLQFCDPHEVSSLLCSSFYWCSVLFKNWFLSSSLIACTTQSKKYKGQLTIEKGWKKKKKGKKCWQHLTFILNSALYTCT